jgi:ketosteroid isomerase-like protein
MTTLEAVTRYYDAWQTKRGDFGDVPLADDFVFTAPVASFDSADGYRAMAREAGAGVTTACRFRHTSFVLSATIPTRRPP